MFCLFMPAFSPYAMIGALNQLILSMYVCLLYFYLHKSRLVSLLSLLSIYNYYHQHNSHHHFLSFVAGSRKPIYRTTWCWPSMQIYTNRDANIANLQVCTKMYKYKYFFPSPQSGYVGSLYTKFSHCVTILILYLLIYFLSSCLGYISMPWSKVEQVSQF